MSSSCGVTAATLVVVVFILFAQHGLADVPKPRAIMQCKFFFDRNYTSYGTINRMFTTSADVCCGKCMAVPNGACQAATFTLATNECQLVADGSQFQDGVAGVIGVLSQGHQTSGPTPTFEPTPIPPLPTPMPTPMPMPTTSGAPQPPATNKSIGVFDCCFPGNCSAPTCASVAAPCGLCVQGLPWGARELAICPKWNTPREQGSSNGKKKKNVNLNIQGERADASVAYSYMYNCDHPITLSVNIYQNPDCGGFAYKQAAAYLNKCDTSNEGKIRARILRGDPKVGLPITRAECVGQHCQDTCEFSYYTSGKCTPKSETTSVFTEYFPVSSAIAFQRYHDSFNCQGDNYTMVVEEANKCFENILTSDLQFIQNTVVLGGKEKKEKMG